MNNPGSHPTAIKQKGEGLDSVGLAEKSLKLMENFYLTFMALVHKFIMNVSIYSLLLANCCLKIIKRDLLCFPLAGTVCGAVFSVKS